MSFSSTIPRWLWIQPVLWLQSKSGTLLTSGNSLRKSERTKMWRCVSWLLHICWEPRGFLTPYFLTILFQLIFLNYLIFIVVEYFRLTGLIKRGFQLDRKRIDSGIGQALDIDDPPQTIRCQNEDECPSDSYRANGLCLERSTVSSRESIWDQTHPVLRRHLARDAGTQGARKRLLLVWDGVKEKPKSCFWWWLWWWCWRGSCWRLRLC